LESDTGAQIVVRERQRDLEVHNPSFAVHDRVALEIIDERKYPRVVSKKFAPKSSDTAFSGRSYETLERCGPNAAPLVFIDSRQSWFRYLRVVLETDETGDTNSDFKASWERSDSTDGNVVVAIELGQVLEFGCR
jgi:hypothetical protein